MIFNGILPALVTPFDAEGRFSETAFERLIERVYAAGVHGVYLCGSTGEGMLQSIAQRKASPKPPSKIRRRTNRSSSTSARTRRRRRLSWRDTLPMQARTP